MKSSLLTNPNIVAAICTAIALSLCSSARANVLCFGIHEGDPSVCSGHGTCVSTDTCECDAGYTGDECQFVACFGVPADDAGACSGHGTCIGPDTCSCEAGHAGDECEFPTCFGLPGFDPSVCSGHGACIAPDICECQVGFIGNECESMALPTVTVGNPGNVGEWSGESYGGHGPDRICGAVDYAYHIGKFEITSGQYTAFLNAVAAEDPYWLYHPHMWTSDFGCKIERTGSSPNHAYSVAPDRADRPVNLVSWGDVARFCNWLHNGQPTGAQDLSTTEDGSYYLNGATTDPELMAIVRKPDATWVIPSEDEWYKAAYHYNDGATGNYYDYPTGSDSVPSNDLIDPDPGNNANFQRVFGDYTIGSPYWRTDVGEFEESESAYGTFDQGGNVDEWNEAVIAGLGRGVRGGSCQRNSHALHAAFCYYENPVGEHHEIGFRVARVSAPVCDLDCDGDGDVDLYDYALLQAVFTGPR